MKIDIIVDTICPWCYVGKKRFDKALAMRPQDNLKVGWRAFQLNPNMPADGMDRRRYVAEKFGGLDHSREVHDGILRAVQEENIYIDFNGIERTPNTLNSHRLVRFAAERNLQTPVVSAIFDGYFQAGLDIGDTGVLCDIAASAGMERREVETYLSSDRDVDTVLAEDELARRLGVNGVPCFIVNRRYAVSGAQSPEVLIQVFDLANQDDATVASP